MAAEYVEASDGLRAERVNSWVEDKHRLLSHYIGATRDVRKKYLPPPQYRAGAAYIDLYCGPGLCVRKDLQREQHGSPLAAAYQAVTDGAPFSEYHIADELEENVDAAAARLRGLLRDVGDHAPVFTYTGKALDVARDVLKRLNPDGLHLVFLDPYGLDALPFGLLRDLSALKRGDLLLHFSKLDFQRNLPTAIREPGGALAGIFDRFSPGWRSHVECLSPDKVQQRYQYITHWAGLLERLGYIVVPSDNFRLIVGKRNQPLYWLVLASRSELARRIWSTIAPHPQRKLDL